MKSDQPHSHKARKSLLGFCILWATVLASILSSTGPALGANFIVLPADDLYADSAYYYLGYFQGRLAKLLGQWLDSTVTLYIASSDEEFARDAGVALPDWGAGVALMEQNKIVIKSPKFMAVGKSFRELVGHELTHIMLNRAAGGRWLPRWMHEGLAMYVSGEWNIGQDILVARASWTGSLIELPAMENLSTFRGPKAALAYTESYLAISRLLRGSDPYLLADLLEMYRKTGDFYGSWNRVVGQTYFSWVSNWLAEVSRQYHLFLFIFDSETFWIALAVLFILLFVLKKLQNAKVKRRWEMEDRLHPPDDTYKKYFDGYYDEENKT